MLSHRQSAASIDFLRNGFGAGRMSGDPAVGGKPLSFAYLNLVNYCALDEFSGSSGMSGKI